MARVFVSHGSRLGTMVREVAVLQPHSSCSCTGSARRREAIRRAAAAGDAAVRKVQLELKELRAQLRRAQAPSGFLGDREAASRAALESALSGCRVTGADRLRGNVAQHAAVAPASGFLTAGMAELRRAQRGPRLRSDRPFPDGAVLCHELEQKLQADATGPHFAERPSKGIDKDVDMFDCGNAIESNSARIHDARCASIDPCTGLRKVLSSRLWSLPPTKVVISIANRKTDFVIVEAKAELAAPFVARDAPFEAASAAVLAFREEVQIAKAADEAACVENPDPKTELCAGSALPRSHINPNSDVFCGGVVETVMDALLLALQGHRCIPPRFLVGCAQVVTSQANTHAPSMPAHKYMCSPHGIAVDALIGREQAFWQFSHDGQPPFADSPIHVVTPTVCEDHTLGCPDVSLAREPDSLGLSDGEAFNVSDWQSWHACPCGGDIDSEYYNMFGNDDKGIPIDKMECDLCASN